MIITANDVLSWRPCPDYTEARVRELMGTGLTPAQVSELPIPVEDRFWVLTHALYAQSPSQARLLACDIAETVAHLGGQVCVDTIAVARRYARGEATDRELASARASARASACASAWASARAAACDAACASARASARAAACDAACASAWDSAYASACASAWERYLAMAFARLDALAAGAEEGKMIPIDQAEKETTTAMSKPLLNDSAERQDAHGALAASADAYVAISNAVRVNTLDAYDDARGVVENAVLAWQGMLHRIDGGELEADDLALAAGEEEKP